MDKKKGIPQTGVSDWQRAVMRNMLNTKYSLSTTRSILLFSLLAGLSQIHFFSMANIGHAQIYTETGIYFTGRAFFPSKAARATRLQHPSRTTNGQYLIRTDA